MRADAALVARGLVRSRGRAQELIRAGLVLADGTTVAKPSQQLADEAVVAVRGDSARWVSRAAGKLAGALDDFGLDVAGAVALDAGACTGGFTQVLLERGAARVFAVDVGHGQLAPTIAADARVVAIEGLNLRDLRQDSLGEPCDLLVADLSFISLTLVLPALTAALSERASAVLLVKPQFEAGRAALDAGGVVRDDRVRADAVVAVAECAHALGWLVRGAAASRVVGGAGNREHLLHLERGGADSGWSMSDVRASVHQD